jgi:hypothetical protein
MRFTDELIARFGSDAGCRIEFARLDADTQRVIAEIDRLAVLLFDKQIIVTAMRKPGRHEDGRMVDFDVDEKLVYGGIAPSEARLLREIVNEAFVYDPARTFYAVVLYGENDPGGTHWNHVHVQTCWENRTKPRNASLYRWLARN